MLGQRINTLRLSCGWSQVELARRGWDGAAVFVTWCAHGNVLKKSFVSFHFYSSSLMNINNYLLLYFPCSVFSRVQKKWNMLDLHGFLRYTRRARLFFLHRTTCRVFFIGRRKCDE